MSKKTNPSILTFPQATGPPGCNRFISCKASLCPLDPEIDKHVWYIDEPICRSTKHGRSKHRWIKKQFSIQRRQTKSWIGKSVTYAMLYKASRKRKGTKKHLENLRTLRERKMQLKGVSFFTHRQKFSQISNAL